MQPLVSRFIISTVLLLGLLFSNSAFADAGGKRANEIGSIGPVPKAQCGPSDRTESGLQGQTTSQERASGDSERGYRCNLELVGQFRGEGAFSQDGPSYFDHCAYMATEKAGLARFVKVPAADGKGHELNLWIVGDAGGFQVLRFTDWYLQTQPGKAIIAEAVAE